ncbi:hypothetical protein [Xylella taiwanensis]|uniref:hypothetical protein n=1 Tax=Xylella taiwanensis TaxID=1444770 RepID=UPI001267F66C|nr:hypothetical protein [Xylella taiwanensis]MCD8465243.1 hypothetical protein [Xylella taiwanensis]UFN23337.1 hypothetical protein LPH48_03935 [Xylella taiwanensis]
MAGCSHSCADQHGSPWHRQPLHWSLWQWSWLKPSGLEVPTASHTVAGDFNGRISYGVGLKPQTHLGSLTAVAGHVCRVTID